MVFTAANEFVVFSLAGRFIDLVTVTDASLFDDEETFVGGSGPDTMTRLVPVSPVFVEAHGQTTIALADGSGAVVLDGVLVELFSPTVGTSDSSLGVVIGFEGVPVEFV